MWQLIMKRIATAMKIKFTYNQVIIQDSEDKLQLSIHKLNVLAKDYNLKISTQKPKTKAFLGEGK